MKNFADRFIMVFSGALAFIAGLFFITDSQVANPNFQLMIDTLFVPSLIAFAALVAFVKIKQAKEGFAL